MDLTIGLDEPRFDASEVARMARLDTKTVANWSDRGFADPYQGAWERKRGRGRARRYSLRDVLRFALMADLAARYQIPLLLGRRICGAAFSEAFAARTAGYLIVREVRSSRVNLMWCGDEAMLAEGLAAQSMKSCLVVNMKLTFENVMREAEALLQLDGGQHA